MNKKEKTFIECYIELDKKNLTIAEIERTRKAGVKDLVEGEFWFKVAKLYNQKIIKHGN